MGKKGEFKERTRNSQRIRERISKRYRRHGVARAQRRNVPIERIARKIYSKEIIWVVRQAI